MFSLLTAVAALAFTLGSCGSSRTVTARGGGAKTGHTRPSGTTGKGTATTYKTVDVSKYGSAAARLVAEASSWQGTPYTWGGNTRDGVDCSGFVVQVYKKEFGISLPRTSASQHKYCKAIKREDLVPGDLVFFATSREHSDVSHVGIYVGSGQMIHASSSKGVITSDLTSDYYSSHFYGAGRIPRFYAMLDVRDADPQPVPATPKALPEETVAATMPGRRAKSARRVPAISVTDDVVDSTATPEVASPAPETAVAVAEPVSAEPDATVAVVSEPIANEPSSQPAAPEAPVHRGARTASAATVSSGGTTADYRSAVLMSLPDEPIGN